MCLYVCMLVHACICVCAVCVVQFITLMNYFLSEPVAGKSTIDQAHHRYVCYSSSYISAAHFPCILVYAEVY